MRLAKLLGYLVAVGAALLSVAIGILWLDHRRETVMPKPTGPYKVSRTSLVWSGSSRVNVLGPERGVKRELVIWIWFPTHRAGPNAAEYMPAPWRAAINQQRGALISNLLTRDLSRVHTNLVRDGEMPSTPSMFPVVLMRPGLAAITLNYSALAEDLASLPDGRVIHRTAENDVDLVSGDEQDKRLEKLLFAWTADVQFVVDQLDDLNRSAMDKRFAGRLDLQRVGVLGHSLGGATAAQFCQIDSRCKAGVDIDGKLLGTVVRDGLNIPFLFLLSDHTEEPDAETAVVISNLGSVSEKLPNDENLLVIRGANHYGFSDDGALMKSPVLQRLLRIVGVIDLDGRQQLDLTSRCVRKFFDAHLNNKVDSELCAPGRQPEVKGL